MQGVDRHWGYELREACVSWQLEEVETQMVEG